MKTASQQRPHKPYSKRTNRSSKVRIGVIGCGTHMRFRHVPEIINNPRAELVSVADPNPAQITKLIELCGSPLPSYTDYQEMVGKESLDAVFICTPHSQHYEQVRFALDHGLHVMVEKPLTIRTTHAEALMELAQKKGLFLTIGYQRFFHEKSLHARHLVASGKIGEICGVVCYITQNWKDVGGWRADPELAGGGFFMDTGSHLVSSMLRITGLKPVEVTALFDNHNKQVDVSGVVTIRFKGGAIGSLNFFGAAGSYDERITIHGTKGNIDLHSCHAGPEPLYLNNKPVKVPAKYRTSSPASALIRWILSKGKNYEPQQTAVETIRLSEAAYKSAGSRKPVSIP